MRHRPLVPLVKTATNPRAAMFFVRNEAREHVVAHGPAPD